MKDQEPKSLEEIAQAVEAQRESEKLAEEARVQKLTQDFKEAREDYLKLKSNSIAGVLLNKADLVARIFPNLVIHGDGPYIVDDSDKDINAKVVGSDGVVHTYSLGHEKMVVQPRLVLSVVLEGSDYSALSYYGACNIRTMKYLDFHLAEPNLVMVDHLYRVRKNGVRPWGFNWNVENWTPQGINEANFSKEIDSILSRFCELHKDRYSTRFENIAGIIHTEARFARSLYVNPEILYPHTQNTPNYRY